MVLGALGTASFSLAYAACVLLLDMRFSFVSFAVFLVLHWCGVLLGMRLRLPALAAGIVQAVRRRWPRVASLIAMVRDDIDALIPLTIMVVVGAYLYRHAPPVASLSEELRHIVFDVQSVGSLVFVLWMLYASGRLLFASEVMASSFATSVFEKAAALQLVPLMIRFFGASIDAQLVWVKANPASSVEAGVAIAAVFFAFRATPSRLVAFSRGSSAPIVRGHSVSPMRKPRSEREVFLTSAHEAGHALMLAALQPRPTEMRAFVIGERGPLDSVLGSVQSNLSPQPGNEPFLRWAMFMCLAGTEAECLVTGIRLEGSGEDVAKWGHFARQYLASGFGEVYFSDAESDADVRLNGYALNRLQEQHREALRAFLQANQQLLAEVTEAITTRKELGTRELTPFLDRVQWVGAVQPVPLELQNVRG